MKLSSYFRDLNSAYQAELDDLTSDSEGKDVLRRRLQDKRSEIGFLLQMIDISPEMVAVVFHQAFRFRSAAATFEPVFRLRDSFELPDWHSLASAVALEPWAEPLAETVLCQPGGEQFLTLAAALEYLQQHGQGASQSASGADSADSAGMTSRVPANPMTATAALLGGPAMPPAGMSTDTRPTMTPARTRQRTGAIA